MKFLGRSLWAATAALLLAALGLAQSNTSPELYQNGNGGVQTADHQFMSEAALAGMAKIHMAYLALQNAQNEHVKAFAQQMLSDYGQSQSDLISIANQLGVQLPSEMDAKDRETFDALSKLQGAAFDKAYVKTMLNGHQADVSRFKQEATKGNNQAMIDWASQTLSTLQSDLKEAQKVAPVVGVHATLTSEEQRNRSAGKPGNKTSQEPEAHSDQKPDKE